MIRCAFKWIMCFSGTFHWWAVILSAALEEAVSSMFSLLVVARLVLLLERLLCILI